jgi:hypothetical protein
VLEPRDRLLLFEALQPPDGFHFDRGIGTTYTLDLLALLTAPLAFTLFEQQGEEGGRPAVDSLEILESLRRHADQLTIFCHAGGIDLPKAFYPQLAFIEQAIVECGAARDGGVFHPKVWALRWTNDEGAARYRVLCLSRNLTFSRAWDTLLSLDGTVAPNRRGAIARNRGLVEFVRALPGLATRKPMAPLVAERAEFIAGELEHTEFEPPDGFTDLRFWPVGIGRRSRDPLAEAGARLLVVSPFVTVGRLEELADGRRDVTLVSTSAALGGLARRPAGITKFYSLLERATIEVDAEHEEKPGSETEAIRQSDLHAKLYVSENGRDAHVWTGSANATTAAFERNVELLVELVGPRKRFGIDALMEPAKGEVRFVNLLQEADRIVAVDRKDAAIEALEEKLEAAREAVARTPFGVRVTPAAADAFDLALVNQGRETVGIDPELTLRCWPVTVANAAGPALETIEAGATIATFPAVSLRAITSFFAFSLTGRASGQERQVRFVLNLPLVGAPEGRREQVLRSMVGDRAKMIRFLWLLLADEGVLVPALGASPGGTATGTEGTSSPMINGLFEMLLRNLDRAPGRLDHLNSLLNELRHGSGGEDLMPTGFDAVWEPIWRQRERLRPKVDA